MTFKEYSLKEAIIIPEVPIINSFFSKNIEQMKEKYPELSFSTDLKSVGGYSYRTKKIIINLDKINNQQDFFKVLFHESVHLIQDKRTFSQMCSILCSETSKSEIKEKMFYLSSFEIMAYASTFALKIIFDGYSINIINSNMYEDIKYKEFFIFKDLKSNKKFLKYVYLYYQEFKKNKNIEQMRENLSESFKTYLI